MFSPEAPKEIRAVNPPAPQPLTDPAVGVAYAASEVDEVPDEPHDQPLDFILTDNELIDVRGVR